MPLLPCEQNGSPAGVLIKTTLVDYPGRVAAAFFVEGCNLRCPYCYNSDLVVKNRKYEAVSAADVLFHLKRRRNVLSGFVISGGEPLLYDSLEELIMQARGLGYNIKLDTNGMCADRLKRIISSAACPDFIALDVKTSPSRYTMLGSAADTAAGAICSSIQMVSALAPAQREFRTVLVPSLIQKKDIEEIASLLPKDASWMFAPFVPGGCIDARYNDLLPYTDAQLNELVSYARRYIPGAQLR
ncbi:MAG TPA: anaerobic ribonucleoside-triphosphate reductase activating protein [Candidatus Treponema faecavium]|nr:anaerobic ribonucleoside-triphosphate reductase activating protein [Candidatus Treponema faecavium]